MQLSDGDRDLMTRLILSEVGPNASPTEQAAIAHNILNRTQASAQGRTTDFPDTVSGVINQRGQYQPMTIPKGAKNSPKNWDSNSSAYQSTASIVDAAAAGKIDDPTNGALYYLDKPLTQQYVQSGKIKKWPDWARGPEQTIGSTTFYQGPQKPASKPPTGAGTPSQSDPDAYFKSLEGQPAQNAGAGSDGPPPDDYFGQFERPPPGSPAAYVAQRFKEMAASPGATPVQTASAAGNTAAGGQSNQSANNGSMKSAWDQFWATPVEPEPPGGLSMSQQWDQLLSGIKAHPIASLAAGGAGLSVGAPTVARAMLASPYAKQIIGGLLFGAGLGPGVAASHKVLDLLNSAAP